MIHLDRNHSDLNQKSNLILSNDHSSTTTPAPTHFSWESIPHEHDPDDSNARYAALADNILAHPSDALQSAHLDFSIVKDRLHSPPQPTRDVIHEDKSSPLSPAPDSASPHHEPKDLPQSVLQPKEESSSFDKGDLDIPREGTLTPLTELSPAPELDDDPDKKEDEDSNLGEAGQFSVTTNEKDDVRTDKNRADALKAMHMNGIPSSSARPGPGSPVRQSGLSAFQNASDAAFSRMTERNVMLAGPSHSQSYSNEFMVPSFHAAHGMPPPNISNASSNAKVIRILELNAELFNVCLEFQLRGLAITDSRFQQYVVRLQTNLTWLAAAADQRHHNPNSALPIIEPPPPLDFTSINRIQHLYSDLPALFAKDIARRQLMSANTNANAHPHPRSHQQPHHNQHTSSSPNGVPNANMNLKRNRQYDLHDVSTSKRRDMGDTKAHGVSLQSNSVQGMPSVPVSGPTPGTSSGQSFASGQRASPPNSFSGPTNTGGIVMPGTPGIPPSPPGSASLGSGMPPPSSGSFSGAGGASGGMPPTLPFGAAEASIAASSRARAREAHIQQAREQQLRQAQMQAAARHMSPPSRSPQGMQNMGGVSGMGAVGVGMGGIGGGQNNAGIPGSMQSQPQPSAPPSMPSMQQLMHVLQNPGHQVMQCMISQVPGFLSMPVQQQLQKMQLFYQMMAQRHQQQNQKVDGQRGMLQNSGMAVTMPNGAMAGSGAGSGPSPISPIGQQSPVMSQSQQIPSQQSPPNGMYPFNQTPTGNSGMDPRLAATVGSNYNQQLAGNTGNMSLNQQRQMMIMQHQQFQQMRNAGTVTNGNIPMGTAAPGMLNSQQQAVYAMNQRMGQAGTSQLPGTGGGSSPMVPPPNDTFPALISNPTIPGIARSTRSPSEGMHSPITPQAASRLSQQQAQNDYQQAMLQQQQQHGQPSFNWPSQAQMGAMGAMGGGGGQMNGYTMGGMGSSNGAGMGGAYFGNVPSPSGQNWSHSGMTGGGSYPYGHGQTMGGQRMPDQARTPTGQLTMGHIPQGSPMVPPSIQNMGSIGDGIGNGEYDIFNGYPNGQ